MSMTPEKTLALIECLHPLSPVPDIILSSHEDPSPWRRDRLKAVYALYHLLWPERAGQIVQLHDHKGCLSVYWRSAPSREAQNNIGTIWGSSVACEADDAVEHLTLSATGLFSDALNPCFPDVKKASAA